MISVFELLVQATLLAGLGMASSYLILFLLAKLASQIRTKTKDGRH